jgi:hypothetical protein
MPKGTVVGCWKVSSWVGSGGSQAHDATRKLMELGIRAPKSFIPANSLSEGARGRQRKAVFFFRSKLILL